jgi:hypothetical protein
VKGRLRALPLRLLTVAALMMGGGLPAAAHADSRFVATGGADVGECPAAAPCRSLGYAYQRASAGDTVQIAAGAYPEQRIARAEGRGAVEFRPADGAAVSLAELTIASDNVTVRGLDAGEVSVSAGDQGRTPVTGVSVIDVEAGGLWLWSAHDLRIEGGSYGPRADHPIAQIAANPPSRNVTIDGVTFHDATASNASVHTECLWVGGVQGLTIRRSQFRNCAYFGVFFTRLDGPDPRDVLLENNVFGVTRSWDGKRQPYGINVSNWLRVAENFTFRNNTVETGIVIQPAVKNFKVVGNTAVSMSCVAGVEYAHNVFGSGECANTDTHAPDLTSDYVAPERGDLRLRPGAAAIDAADPEDAPATDLTGAPRIGLPDAGALESGVNAAPRVLTSATLRRTVLCARSRRGCRQTSTRVRVSVARRTVVTATIRRSGSGRRVRTVFRRTLAAGRHELTLRVRGLPRGRYRLDVRAGRAETARPGFRVR